MQSTRLYVKYVMLGTIALLCIFIVISGSILAQNYKSNFESQADVFNFPRGWLIERLEIDPQGQMWVFARVRDAGIEVDSGIFVYKEEVIIQKFTGNQVPGQVKDFAFNKAGGVWAATQNEIIYLNEGQWKNLNLPQADNQINLIECDRDGNLWVGTEDTGVFVWNGEKWQQHNTDSMGITSEAVRGIAFDGTGRAWIASNTGATVYNGKSWVKHAPENSGQETPIFKAVAIDSKNRAWFATNKGVRMLDGTTWTQYGNDDQNIILIDQQDRVWVGSSSTISVLAAVVDGKYKKSSCEMIPASVAPDGRIWAGGGKSCSTDMALSTAESDLFQEMLVMGFLLANPIIVILLIVLLSLGGWMEMWGEMGASMVLGMLGYAASRIGLDILGYTGIVSFGSLIIWATMMALGMTAGLAWRWKKIYEPVTDAKKNTRSAAFVFFLSVTVLCLIEVFCWY